MSGSEPDEQDRRHQDEHTTTMQLPDTGSGEPHGRHVSPAEADSGTLLIRRGPQQGTQFAVHAAVTTLGRGRECDITLDDVTVSRTHAEIRHEDNRFTVVDSGSLNGTYVNSTATSSAVLADGDEIWIGKFRMVFSADTPTD